MRGGNSVSWYVEVTGGVAVNVAVVVGTVGTATCVAMGDGVSNGDSGVL